MKKKVILVSILVIGVVVIYLQTKNYVKEKEQANVIIKSNDENVLNNLQSDEIKIEDSQEEQEEDQIQENKVNEIQEKRVMEKTSKKEEVKSSKINENVITSNNTYKEVSKEVEKVPEETGENPKETIPEIDLQYEELKKKISFKDYQSCSAKSVDLALEYAYNGDENFQNTFCESVAYNGELLGYSLTIFFRDGTSSYYK